jgi:hypothetical protein
MPAILPVVSMRRTVAAPINAPPIAAGTGVKTVGITVESLESYEFAQGL